MTAGRREIGVGAVVASSRVPRWVATCREASRRRAGAGRACLRRERRRAQAPALPAAFRLYESLDAWLFRTDADPLEPVELAPPPPLLPARRSARGGGLSSTDVATLAAAQLDVILDFVGLDDPAAGAARYGVWSVEQTDAAGSRCDAWLFAPMRERRVFRTSIVAEREGRRIVLYESFGASDPVSLHRARAGACWKAAGRLAEPPRRAGIFRLGRPRGSEPAIDGRAARNALDRRWRAGGAACRQCRRRSRSGAGFASSHSVTSGSSQREWVPSVAPDGLHPVTVLRPFENPPTSHQFADPFPFVHDGRAVPLLRELLATETPRRRSGSSRSTHRVVRLPSRGRLSSAITTSRTRSCSDYGGEIFMIPESSENRTIDLYRASRFPEEWQLEQTLFSGVARSGLHDPRG